MSLRFHLIVSDVDVNEGDEMGAKSGIGGCAELVLRGENFFDIVI